MIKCEISGEVIELAPAQATQLVLQVINQSPVIDYFTLRLVPGDNVNTLSLDPTWVTFSPPSFSLRPAQLGRSVQEGEAQQSVTIIVTLPPGIPAGSYTAKIQVAARTGPDNSAEVPLNLVVSEVENQTLVLEPVEQISRSKVGIFRIAVSNQGNMPHLYSVYGEDDDNRCYYEVRPPEVMLEQGQDALMTLRVRPRSRNWASENASYPFTLKLEGFTQETSGRFVQRCALPPLFWLRRHWGRVAIAGMVVLALLVGVLIFILAQIKPAIAADVCGPPSTRRINLVSNSQETQIWVSGPNGNDPLKKEVDNLDGRIIPGLFYSLISVSPDGRRLAYVSADNEALDGARITVIELDSANRQPKLVANVPTTGLWPTAPVWSADGTQLAFVVRPGAKTTAVTAAPAITGTVTITATAAPVTTNQIPPLELWIASNTGDAYQAKQLATPDKQIGNGPAKLGERLRVDMFYGEQRRTLCWTVDNQNVLVNPKPGDTLAKVPTKITLAGDVKEADLTGKGATFVAPTVGVPKLNSGPDNNKLFAPNLSVNNEPPQQQKSPCAVPQPYSQNDPRWADRTLKDRTKMSDTGCAIVAGAMFLNSIGVTTNPNDLINNCLGTLAYPLDQKGWSRLEACSNNKLKGGIRGDFTWSGLDAALKQGPAIVGLLGGQTGSHFVVVNSGGNAVVDSYYVTDPWDGSTYKNLDYFLSKGYRVKWLVSYDSGSGLSCGAVNDPLAIQLNGVNNGELSQQSKTISYDVNSNIPVTATVRYFGPKGISSDQPNPETLLPNQRKPYNQEGLYLITFDANSTQNSQDNVYFVVDKTPPILDQPIFSSAPNKEGKYPGPVTIQFKAIDALSGIADIEYKIDSDANWQEFRSDTTNNPLILQEGIHTIYSAAEDGAGNRIENAPVTIEVINPQAKPTPTPGTSPRANTSPGAAGQPGQPGGQSGQQSGQPVNPIATRVPTPTPTPRPTLTPTATPLPTFTRVPTATPTIAPTLTPPPASTTASGAGGGTPAASATPQVAPVLVVSTTQVVFDTNTDQKIQISNSGNGPLTWSLKPGQNADLVGFSSTGGTIAVGGKFDLTIQLKSINLDSQSKKADFQIASDGGNATVRISIVSQPLPTALFISPVPPVSGQLTTLNVSVSLSVTVPGLAQPDHAKVVATYKDPATGIITDFVIAANLTASANWTFVWDTSNVPAQTSVKLGGLICVDAAEQLCKPIQTLSGLLFELDAAFISPPPNVVTQPFTDTISVVMTHTERVNHITLSYVFAGSSIPVTIATQVGPPGWSLNLPTQNITPTIGSQQNSFQIKALACSSTTDLICRPVSPAATNLSTIMTATIQPSQNLSTIKALPPSLSFSVSNATQNINHISLYASYAATPGSVPSSNLQWLSGNIIRRPLGGALPSTLTWNTDGLPFQSGITLELRACFTSSELLCSKLVSYDNLVVSYALPLTITPGSDPLQYFPVGTLNFSPFRVVIRDNNGVGVAGKPITFTVQPTGAVGGNFSGASTVVVNTGSDGVANSPSFSSNAIGSIAPPAGFFDYRVIANLDGATSGGGSKTFTFRVFNMPNTTYLNPFNFNYFNGISPIPNNYSVGSQTSSVPVGTGTLALLAHPYSYSSGTSGIVRIVFFAPLDGPSGTFANNTTTSAIHNTAAKYTYMSVADYLPEAFKANQTAGSYRVLAWSDAVIPGIPVTNPPGTQYTYPPAIYFITNNPTGPVQPAVITAVDNQHAAIGQPFTKRIQVKVVDNFGNPLSGVTVTFGVQAVGGAGGTFDAPGSAVTNAGGVAYAPPFIANNTPGAYTVTATVSGATALTYNMVNDPIPVP